MKEFTGPLESISAGRLIGKDKSNDFDNFFLVLGLIYNDLKDILFFVDSLNKEYRIPKIDGTEPVSVHIGQWGGIQNHINRLTIGLISEFLIFLEKNKDVTNTVPFKLFEKSLPNHTRKDWGDILNVLDNKNSDDFLSQIARIRSNVSFHYDQSLTELRSGFIKKFFINKKDLYNGKAYYSLGNTMETSRFYYCDGAAEEYLKEHMVFSSEENYFENIKGLIKNTNSTIRIMMQVYIDLKLKKKF